MNWTRRILAAVFLVASVAWISFSSPARAPEREVLKGMTTNRPVPGAPYELAGKRIVFTNWHYIQPGDLDWRDGQGKSVYVDGNKGLFEAHHLGINAPRGIRLMAEKPQIAGPLSRPHRMILRDGSSFKGWTDSDYYESKDRCMNNCRD